MIHFIYGKTGSGKTETVFSEMEKSAKHGKVFLLVPDREAVASESRAAELKNAQNIDVLTFGRLCNYIFRRKIFFVYLMASYKARTPHYSWLS